MAGYELRFAERVKRERKKKGWSRDRAAYEIGISSEQYGRWERGESEPRAGSLEAAATAFGLTVQDLKPDPEAEEQALREQLNRIEKMLRVLLAHAGYGTDEVDRFTAPTEAPGAVPDLPEVLLPEGARASNGETTRDPHRSRDQERQRRSA